MTPTQDRTPELTLDEALATIRRLNRRCQSAEAGLAEKITANAGVSLGRSLANASATMHREQNEELRAEVVSLRSSLSRLEGEQAAAKALVVEGLVAAITERAKAVPLGDSFGSGGLCGASIYNVHRFAVDIIRECTTDLLAGASVLAVDPVSGTRTDSWSTPATTEAPSTYVALSHGEKE